jgi:hypothetical protein
MIRGNSTPNFYLLSFSFLPFSVSHNLSVISLGKNSYDSPGSAYNFISLVSSTACTVCYSPGFGNLRPCVAGCIGCAGTFTDEVRVGIGCGRNAPNECYYRTDLFTFATSAINACDSQHCASAIGGWEGGYSSAASVYQSYCRGAGFTTEPAHAATTTFDPNVPTVTQATFVTQNSASPSPGSVVFGS